MATINPTIKGKNGENKGKAGAAIDPNPSNTGGTTPSASIVTKKTKAPVTAEQFLAKAAALTVSIGGSGMPSDPNLMGAPRQFSTGSLGWNMNGKVTVMVDGKPVTVQCSINLTVVGSKPE
jgi:hypothetical protein